MAGGANYCVVSRLPIEGEECMLFPLRFKLSPSAWRCHPCSYTDYLDLFQFVAEPVKVFYGEWYNDVKYPEGHSHNNIQYEHYMLVHLGFYKKIVSEYQYCMVGKLKDVVLNHELEPIYNIAKEMLDNALNDIYRRACYGKTIFDQKDVEATYNMAAPQWMIDLQNFAMFMDKLGIKPYPNNSITQTSEAYHLYNKVRNSFLTQSKEDDIQD